MDRPADDSLSSRPAPDQLLGRGHDQWPARAGGQIVFEVSDHGRGIPAGKLESIFERFLQVDASDSRDKGGSGLGLAISRSIVRQHGGEISVTSEVGAGSTFRFTLPAPLTDASVASASSGLVLICDDDPETRDALRDMLTRRGYDIREVASGESLHPAIAAHRPDVILLDIFMPGMNGWEALARLRNDPETADVPVVIVSVLGREENGEPLFDLSGWIHKPLDEQHVAETVDGVCRVQRKPRVLLVEDDLDLARVVTASFERYGVEIVHAVNGRQAIELSTKMQPDLLVLDLILPEVDGFQVVEWLKDHQLWRNVPLVVYSALEPTPSQKERLTLGSTEFMTKSRTSPEEFERRVMGLLEQLTQKRRRHVA